MLHLDANAGAAVHEAAWTAYCAASQNPASPRALHEGGLRARAQLRQAQSAIASVIGAQACELMLVSGGTEADAWALSSALAPPGAPESTDPSEVVISGIEHAAVTKTLDAWAKEGRVRPVLVPAGRSGRMDPAAIEAAITPHTRLVSMTWACNETGVLQPMAEVLAICRDRGILLHTDAVQAVGRVPVDVRLYDVDMLSLSGHKLGAIGGVGALYVKAGTPALALYPDAAMLDVASAASLAAALQHRPDAALWDRVQVQRDALELWASQHFGDALEVIGQYAPRLPNTSCLRFAGCSAEAMMMALDVAHIAVATGSACSTGAIDPSPLLLGMGLSPEEAKETIRLSFHAPITDEAMASLKVALLRAQHALAGRRF